MTSLLAGVKLGREQQEANILLLRALDHVLFNPEQCGFPTPWDDGENLIWLATQRELRDAIFRVRLGVILQLPGMSHGS